jgi:uncharacterized protein YnzC (UPF0291/DUF896 family)
MSSEHETEREHELQLRIKELEKQVKELELTDDEKQAVKHFRRSQA